VDYNEEEVEGDCDGKDEQMKKKMRKKWIFSPSFYFVAAF
jgi:hypothetical protein